MDSAAARAREAIQDVAVTARGLHDDGRSRSHCPKATIDIAVATAAPCGLGRGLLALLKRRRGARERDASQRNRESNDGQLTNGTNGHVETVLLVKERMTPWARRRRSALGSA